MQSSFYCTVYYSFIQHYTYTHTHTYVHRYKHTNIHIYAYIHTVHVTLSHLRSKESTGIDVAWENPSFKFFDLPFDQ